MPVKVIAFHPPPPLPLHPIEDTGIGVFLNICEKETCTAQVGTFVIQ